jgi:hypothetical protein
MLAHITLGADAAGGRPLASDAGAMVRKAPAARDGMEAMPAMRLIMGHVIPDVSSGRVTGRL